MTRRAAAALLLASVAAASVAPGCAIAHRDRTRAAVEARKTPEQNRFGIEILGIRRSAAGAMLDLRYRILDPEAASDLVDRRLEAYLIDEATGDRLGVPSGPTVGPMRQTVRAGTPPLGSVLFVLFANPRRSVEKGDRVTVVIGDFRAESLAVE